VRRWSGTAASSTPEGPRVRTLAEDGGSGSARPSAYDVGRVAPGERQEPRTAVSDSRATRLAATAMMDP